MNPKEEVEPQEPAPTETAPQPRPKPELPDKPVISTRDVRPIKDG